LINDIDKLNDMTVGRMTIALDKSWNNIKWVLTDVDDTLTWQGQLPPQTLVALANLRQANIKVVAVTGACAGWCDHIAQLWPVDAVLGENGAFIMEKVNGALTITTAVELSQMRDEQEKLKHQINDILQDYPQLNLTLDQAYRLCEVAIDIGQNRPEVDPAIVSEVVTKIGLLGASATASSIHINAWYGQHSKKQTSLRFLREQGLTEQQIQQQVCYVGDSLNDQQMFATLPLTIGVANIKDYWLKLEHHPSIVMSQPGGYGFAEFVQLLLEKLSQHNSHDTKSNELGLFTKYN
jgi:HAD superfamily hydrolase (TIGR01484 family)